MPLKTTTLETSKRLKEAQFRQDSIWYWINYQGTPQVLAPGFVGDKICSAPTTDELLEELPSNIKGNEFFVDRFHDKWFFGYYELYHDDKPYLDSPVEALALLWLWLKKENLI